MTLDFVLLIVDDAPDLVHEALETLREYLDARGFRLRVREANDFSDEGLRALAAAQGRDYDLVMVDYHLGPTAENGAVVASRLRTQLQYTDMVFYSSDPEAQLFAELAGQRVPGVFVAEREELAAALIGLADTVIRESVDLTHMRGIAMAEVAEMDTLMEETLSRALQSDDTLAPAAARRLITELTGNLNDDAEWLRARLEHGEFLEVVGNSRLFTFMHKYRLVRTIARRLPNRPAALLDRLRPFADDITPRRNKLAHVKEEIRADGTVVLRSIKPGEDDVVIDEIWMQELRGLLRRHKPALVDLCRALDLQLGGVRLEAEAQQR